jgi:sugar phosphate isomerase/epimerase
MPRPVILFTGQWTDLSLDELAQKTAEWGYQGLELACWGDHFEVQRALGEDDYCQTKLDLLGRHDLNTLVVSNHRVGTAVCDVIDDRHQALLPEYVWGDGQREGVRQRAVAEMIATIRAAQKLGVSVVGGFTGSPIWSYVAGFPGPKSETITAGLSEFARLWNPILDVCQECGVRFAFEVHPGQIAFDLHSAEMVLDAIHGREEFGFLFDASHFHWQGVDPAEFVRRFPDRICHVHVKDCALSLNGRNGILGSYLPYGDPRRGWEPRGPGRGGINWESVLRALNDAGYEGPLSGGWNDAGVDRDFGAEEACRFVKRLDFEPSRRR